MRQYEMGHQTENGGQSLGANPGYQKSFRRLATPASNSELAGHHCPRVCKRSLETNGWDLRICCLARAMLPCHQSNPSWNSWLKMFWNHQTRTPPWHQTSSERCAVVSRTSTNQLPYKTFWQRPACWTLDIGGNHIDDKKETKYALIKEMLRDGGSGANATAVGYEECSVQAVGPPAAKKKTLGDLLKSWTTTTSTSIPKRARADKLTHYLQEEPTDSKANQLTWWHNNQGRFPLLSKVACKYMCICATSTPEF